MGKKRRQFVCGFGKIKVFSDLFLEGINPSVRNQEDPLWDAEISPLPGGKFSFQNGGPSAFFSGNFGILRCPKNLWGPSKKSRLVLWGVVGCIEKPKKLL